MSELPIIRTAIPRRRFRIAGYLATLLDEIESGDGRDYRFILAFVKAGQAAPEFFVCSERNPGEQSGPGTHRMRIVNKVMSEIMETGDQWKDEQQFTAEAIKLGRQALSLGEDLPIEPI